MDDNIVTVAKKTIETAEKFSRIEKEHPALLLFARAVVRQDDELAAIREKLRWRKQSDEHAPANERVLIYDAYREHFTVDVCMYLDTVNYIFWRPLDLPEHINTERGGGKTDAGF